jgi:hypothetical protein
MRDWLWAVWWYSIVCAQYSVVFPLQALLYLDTFIGIHDYVTFCSSLCLLSLYSALFYLLKPDDDSFYWWKCSILCCVVQMLSLIYVMPFAVTVCVIVCCVKSFIYLYFSVFIYLYSQLNGNVCALYCLDCCVVLSMSVLQYFSILQKWLISLWCSIAV